VGFLRRFTNPGRGSTPGGQPAGPITTWPTGDFESLKYPAWFFDPAGRATVEVVGESRYQGTLEQIAGGRTIDGPRNPDHQATLIPEPSNPYDQHAVRVYVGPPFHQVGYLGREDAVAYRPLIDRLAATGQLVACLASLKGGWDRGPKDRAMFGVTLHLDKPDNLMAELDKGS
jgi:hypothetical protein